MNCHVIIFGVFCIIAVAVILGVVYGMKKSNSCDNVGANATLTISNIHDGTDLIYGGSLKVRWKVDKVGSSDVIRVSSKDGEQWHIEIIDVEGYYSKTVSGKAGTVYNISYMSCDEMLASAEIKAQSIAEMNLQCLLESEESNSAIKNVVIIIMENESYDRIMTNKIMSISAPYFKSLGVSGSVNDMYFTPMTGASSGNNMYFGRGAYVFPDNNEWPANSTGKNCFKDRGAGITYEEPTVMDLLIFCKKSVHWYGEGYQEKINNPNLCGPKYYDPSDTFHQYYKSTRDVLSVNKDYSQFESDIRGQMLPSVSYIKPILEHSCHKPFSIMDCEDFVRKTLAQINASSYYNSRTLVMITFDEYGFFYDSVARNKESQIDQMISGYRTPLYIAGYFSRPGYISHIKRDHSSLIRFLEWNFLGANGVGFLQTRDTNIDGNMNNIGDMLLNVEVPSN